MDYRRARGDPQLEVAEGDVVGIAIDMDMGSVSFYKIKDKDKGEGKVAPCDVRWNLVNPHRSCWEARRATSDEASIPTQTPCALNTSHCPSHPQTCAAPPS